MEFPITVEDQAAFDKLVGTRLTREREKFSDYDDLKTQVATLTEAAKAHDGALAAAVKRAEDAEGKVAARDEADAFAKVRTEVATAAGVPADVLRGTTKEELEAHAAALKPLITAPKGPVIPTQVGEGRTTSSTEATAVIRRLWPADDQQPTRSARRRLRVDRSHVVGPVGLEPTTRGLKVRCSAS